MSNFLTGMSSRFRGGGRSSGTKSPGGVSGVSSPVSPTGSTLTSSSSSANLAPRVPPVPNSPSLSQSLSMDDFTSAANAPGNDWPYKLPTPKPLWLNNAYSKHIVKGNFMTLSHRPQTVEPGEWIAHQTVEHYRTLWNFVNVVHSKDEKGHSICNEQSCPKTSAGENHSFTWMNANKELVEVSGHQYMTLMQKWIGGKLEDPKLFPTDPNGVSSALSTGGPDIAASTYASGGLNTPGSSTPIPAGPTTLNTSLAQLAGSGTEWIGKSSGFPEKFFVECQAIFLQMFRVYAHLYWSHYTDPFYHLSLDKHLNSCFSHFILTALALDLLVPRQMGPMQPLIDLWAANGTFPPDSKAYACANLAAGQRLLVLAGGTN